MQLQAFDQLLNNDPPVHVLSTHTCTLHVNYYLIHKLQRIVHVENVKDDDKLIYMYVA